MSITRRDQLFLLIQSLTKAEKRNFRLYVTRIQSNEDVKFVRLFDIMDKMDGYDEALILKRLSGVRKGQLANLKRHLYNQILKSLRMIHVEKNMELQIREQIDHARILYEKGLYLQALKLLERTRGRAEETHQNILLLEIIEFLKYIEERHITRSRKIEGKMEKLLDQADDVEKGISNMVRLSNLKIKIHGLYITMGHARNEEDYRFVADYFKKELERIKEEELTVTEHIYLEQSYMWYYYILLDFDKCNRHASRWVELFDSHPHLKEEDPVLYMRGLSYMLTTLYSMRKYDAYVRALEKFEVFDKERSRGFTRTQRIIHFLYLTTARINKHFMEGSFQQGIKLVPHIERQIRKYEGQIDIHRIMVFNYKLAWLYFGAGDFNTSIDYLNAIIQARAGHLREDIQCYARLLHLIAHYELDHQELLKYQVESVARFFDKMRDLNQVQKTVLDFFRKSLSAERTPIELFKQLKEKVLTLSKDPYERRAFHHLDILAWIDSKILGLSLEETIRRKFAKAP